MKFTGVILFASVAAATVLRRQGNPFAGLPNVSSLGICIPECQTVSQAQENPASDWSTICTPTFASAVQGCLNCCSTTIPAYLLTDDIKNAISSGIEIYEEGCVVFVSTTEIITLPTALAATGAAT